MSPPEHNHDRTRTFDHYFILRPFIELAFASCLANANVYIVALHGKHGSVRHFSFCDVDAERFRRIILLRGKMLLQYITI